MSRADRTIVSTLALSLALSGPVSAQNTALTRDALPEAAKSRFDALVAACEANGSLPPGGLESLTGELNCDAILDIAESETPAGDPAEGEGSAGVTSGAEAETGAEADAEAEAGAAAEAGAETGAETEADPSAAADAGTEEASDTEAEAGVAAEAEADADADAEVEVEDAEVEVESDTNANAEADAATQSDVAEDADTTEDAGATATESNETDAEIGADELEQALEGEAAASTGTDAETDVTGEGAQDDTAETDATGDAAQDDTADAEEPAEEENATTAEADAAETDGTDSDDTTAEVEEAEDPEDAALMDSQAQADAVAESDNQSAAAAAAASSDDSAGEPEVTEEVVEENAVRESSEDFSTAADGQARAESDDDDDDDDRNNTLRNAALLGLGAVALNEILRGDERVVSNTGDRVVVEDNGQLRVLRNDDVLLRRPGAEVQSFNYSDGSTRQVITYEDGTSVETVRAADGRVLRRTRILSDGSEIVLFDDTRQSEAVAVNELPQTTERRSVNFQEVGEDQLAAALTANEAQGVNRSFSLNQIRNIDAVRELVPEITVDSINFQTASAAIRPSEAQELAALGNAMRRMIEDNPNEVFLVEGHTDAVGSAGYNLALSDRRAESVALALTEYFDVPPSNMVLQGYGESDLLVQTNDAERRNRRAAVRRITPLLR